MWYCFVCVHVCVLHASSISRGQNGHWIPCTEDTDLVICRVGAGNHIQDLCAFNCGAFSLALQNAFLCGCEPSLYQLRHLSSLPFLFILQFCFCFVFKESKSTDKISLKEKIFNKHLLNLLADEIFKLMAKSV